jgi:hypothetical protein
MEVPQSLLESLADTVPAPAPKAIKTPTPADGTKPGDLYNQEGDLAPLLVAHGWQLVGEYDGNQQWRRPGKLAGNHSATWNGEVFYVFSSAAAPFEGNKGYSAFGVYSILEHGGDHHVAAKTLAQEGYKDPSSTYPRYPGVDLSPFLEQFIEVRTPSEAPEQEEEEKFPEHLLVPPGFMGEVIQHNQETAPKQQPVLALAAALALQAILCARKVKTVYGARPNLMICGVAPSGAGKEHARSLNRRILVESGLSHLHAEGIKSGSGLVNALTTSPALLFQLDEYGRFLKASKNPEKNPYAYEIISKLLTLYTSSGSLYESDRYADKEKGGVRIVDPHAIVYGTTVPRSLYDGLTEESVTDGFLARTLIFDSGTIHPLRRILPEKPIPRSIIDHAIWWGKFWPGTGNLDPDPIAVPVTPEAQHLATAFILTEAKHIAEMGDSPMATLWTRTAQNADKLALLYACSVDHEHPVIDLPAAQWAYDLAEYLTQRMITLVGDNVASSQFHGEALKLKAMIKRNGGKLDRYKMVKNAHMRSRDLEEIINYMLESGIIKLEETHTGGRKKLEYVLA